MIGAGMKMNLQLIHFSLVDEEEAVQQKGGIKEKSLNHTVLDHLQNYLASCMYTHTRTCTHTHMHTHMHTHTHIRTRIHIHIVVT